MSLRADDGSGMSPLSQAGLRRMLRGAQLDRVLAAMRPQPREGGPCPACGWTRGQYESTGLLACGLCYSVYGIGPLEEPTGPAGSSHTSEIG
jgi:hypothetical protein